MNEIEQEVSFVNNQFNSIFLDECTETYTFGLTDKALELIKKDHEDKNKHPVWGNVGEMALYAAAQVIENQWIPHKLFYKGHDKTKSLDEGGEHVFYWKCQNRKMKNFWNFIQKISEATEEKPMKIDEEEYQILKSMDGKKLSTFYKPPSGVKGFWRGIPFEVIE